MISGFQKLGPVRAHRRVVADVKASAPKVYGTVPDPATASSTSTPLLSFSPLRPSRFLSGGDFSAGCHGHCAALWKRIGSKLFPFGLGPACSLSSRDTRATRRGNVAGVTDSIAGCSPQCGDCPAKSVHLGRETIAFLLKLFDYRAKVSHAENSSVCYVGQSRVIDAPSPVLTDSEITARRG
jgi:hypothetical protein